MAQKTSAHLRAAVGSFTLVGGATAAPITVPGMTAKSMVVLTPTDPGAGAAGTRYIVTPGAGSFTVQAVSTAGANVATDVTVFDYIAFTDPAQT
jgi:hypothetical protein